MLRSRILVIILISIWFLTACGFFSASPQIISRLARLPQAEFSSTHRPPTGTPTITPDPLPTWIEEKLPNTDKKQKSTPDPVRSPPATLLEEYMPEHEKLAETEHYVIYTQDGYFPVDQVWWLEQVEEVYAYVSDRMQNAQVKEKILLGFVPPDEQVCPVRGLASHDHPPVVLIFASPESSRAYLLGVLAHETGHAISSEGIPGGMPDDLALTEGLATWASEKYWIEWIGASSLDALIQQYMDDGIYESIRENYNLHGIYPWQNPGKDCLARRDKVYSEWASFLGYLIRSYGWVKAYQLFRTPPPKQQEGQEIHFPPDYEGIYGKSLNQLESEWLNDIKERFRGLPQPVGSHRITLQEVNSLILASPATVI